MWYDISIRSLFHKGRKRRKHNRKTHSLVNAFVSQNLSSNEVYSISMAYLLAFLAEQTLALSFVEPLHNKVLLIVLLLPNSKILFNIGIFTCKDQRLTQASSCKRKVEWLLNKAAHTHTVSKSSRIFIMLSHFNVNSSPLPVFPSLCGLSHSFCPYWLSSSSVFYIFSQLCHFLLVISSHCYHRPSSFLMFRDLSASISTVRHLVLSTFPILNVSLWIILVHPHIVWSLFLYMTHFYPMEWLAKWGQCDA